MNHTLYPNPTTTYIILLILSNKYNIKPQMVDLIEDPSNDRVITEVIPPPLHNLSHSKLFPKKNLPDWKELKEHLKQEGKLDKTDILELVSTFKNIIKSESNVIKVQDPLIIVGDLHGQFYDLLRIFTKGGDPSITKYLFLGDYVDRGAFSIECVLYLMSLKINFKNTFYMLRGNHECRRLTSYFNFKMECEVKYDLEIYENIMEAFDCLPLVCIINERFIALHGGISPTITYVNDIHKFNRFTEPPTDGAFCDILWADPIEKDVDALVTDWAPNRTRGCSFVFGAKAAIPFLNCNNYLTVIRGHEVQLDGFKINQWNTQVEFPSVITVFSAPNYCDVYNNKGAFIKFIDSNINIQQCNFSPHPFILPNFMNVFNWSIPFVSEKLSEMLIYIIKRKDEVSCDDGNLINETVTHSLKMKMKIITMLMKMYRTLREENELILKLKGFCPGNRIPKGILLQGAEALKTALERYKTARTIDKINERMPIEYQ